MCTLPPLASSSDLGGSGGGEMDGPDPSDADEDCRRIEVTDLMASRVLLCTDDGASVSSNRLELRDPPLEGVLVCSLCGSVGRLHLRCARRCSHAPRLLMLTVCDWAPLRTSTVTDGAGLAMMTLRRADRSTVLSTLKSPTCTISSPTSSFCAASVPAEISLTRNGAVLSVPRLLPSPTKVKPTARRIAARGLARGRARPRQAAPGRARPLRPRRLSRQRRDKPVAPARARRDAASQPAQHEHVWPRHGDDTTARCPADSAPSPPPPWSAAVHPLREPCAAQRRAMEFAAGVLPAPGVRGGCREGVVMRGILYKNMY